MPPGLPAAGERQLEIVDWLLMTELTWLIALILAVVQGATEFIPVSSSGHLVIISSALGLPDLPVAFAVTLHLGTLLAVVVYFRREVVALVRGLWDPTAEICGAQGEKIAARSLLLPLFLGTLPAVVAGLALKDQVEVLFGRPLYVACFLILTALVLLAGDVAAARQRTARVDPRCGFIIGLGQAASALMRGLSRSGTTITVGLCCGLSREMAAKFSFLLSVIIVAGAGLVEGKDLLEQPLPAGQLPIYLVSGVVAALVGYASIFIVLDTVKRGSLFKRFGIYCVVLAAATLVAGLTGYLG